MNCQRHNEFEQLTYATELSRAHRKLETFVTGLYFFYFFQEKFFQEMVTQNFFSGRVNE